MDKEKNKMGPVTEDDFSGESSTRARNRTVMLTPEITGQVRARLQAELEPGAPQQALPNLPNGMNDFGGPQTGQAGGGGFVTPNRGGFEPRGSSSGGFGRGEEGFSTPQPIPTSTPNGPAPTSSIKSAVPAKVTPIMGFLVSFDQDSNGEVFELRSGRIIVTSEEVATGNALLIRDESVSPMHAILRVSQGGEIQVLDQLSEHGTKIKRFGSEEEEELSGDKGTIEHGDIISFGKRKFHVCLVVRGE